VTSDFYLPYIMGRRADPARLSVFRLLASSLIPYFRGEAGCLGRKGTGALLGEQRASGYLCGHCDPLGTACLIAGAHFGAWVLEVGLRFPKGFQSFISFVKM